ncbi:MAG: sugar phosphate isomerase/epimerase [Planctomycetaceae bacterium]|nr:sugar phosphate isomerase/epimerase [Planctomycetaceae bacterium]
MSSYHSSRRQFLQTSLLGTAALTVPDSLFALQKCTSTNASPMKLSLAAYSFNRYLPNSWRGTPKPGSTMTLHDFIEYCGEQELEGTELTGYYFPENVTQEYLEKTKQFVKQQGLEISGTAIGNDFCVPEGEKLDFELNRAKQWIDNAAVMGAPVIRVFAGRVPKGDREEAAIERCADTMNKALEYAAKRRVKLALENHGGITSTPEQMMSIIDKIDSSPWFGINFDSGNFQTDDPYRDLEKIAPLAINAQIKVAVRRDGKKEPADLKRIVGILKQAKYEGFVVLEYEEKENPREQIPGYLAQLRELIYG